MKTAHKERKALRAQRAHKDCAAKKAQTVPQARRVQTGSLGQLAKPDRKGRRASLVSMVFLLW